jgi:phenylpyruvate tautomerase PptA (4-oxalocrotonate tautomerase family)
MPTLRKLRAERAPDTAFLREHTLVYLHAMDVADVHAAVTRAADIDPDGSWAFHVWTLIHEVPEGNWGGGGKVIYYADVKGLTTDGA